MRTAYEVECLYCQTVKEFPSGFKRSQWKRVHQKRSHHPVAFLESVLTTDYNQCQFCGNIGICIMNETEKIAWCGRCDGITPLIAEEMEKVS